MWSVTVSPDGKHIAYIAQTKTESQIVAIDADGANPRVLARRPLALNFWFIEWSPFPDTMAAVAIGKHDMGLMTVDLQTGTTRDLSVSGWGAVGQPAWSPDGLTIFTPAVSAQPGSLFQIWAFDARSGAHRPLTSGSTPYSEWSLSATASGDLFAITDIAHLSLWVTERSGQTHRVPALRGEGSDSVIWIENRIVTSNISEMMVHDLNLQTSTKLSSYSSIYRQLWTVNGNQGSGRNGDSTSGLRLGSSQAFYCSVNLMNLDIISIENVVVVRSPAYHFRFSNVGNVTVSGCVMKSRGVGTDGLHFDGPANDIRISNCSL